MFVNLYKSVLSKKRKLIEKGRNHPCAKFDKFLTKKRNPRLSTENKIGLVERIIIKQRIVVIPATIRGLPSLKILIIKPNNAHRGI
tara:strand:- start:643 stop:900 length:258 start_codon:yes stop_codon:yes gene_type:complete